jgi:hypothetical protein
MAKPSSWTAEASGYSSLNSSAMKRGSSMLVVLAKPITVRPVARSIAALKVDRIAC